jgi:RNA polymerase sigma factor (sigma-70 family)
LETNPSIFVRLNRDDTRVRELAWQAFHQRYAPIIADFARRLGCRRQDIDDVVQDVMIGFYAKSPSFTYDPTQGRFRSYLMACTCHVLHKRQLRRKRAGAISLDQLDPQTLEVQHIWNDLWEQQQIRLAVEQVRRDMGPTRTFRAFEMYVILDEPAEGVAQKLGMHIDSVYRAKQQVSRLVREKLEMLRREEE